MEPKAAQTKMAKLQASFDAQLAELQRKQAEVEADKDKNAGQLVEMDGRDRLLNVASW